VLPFVSASRTQEQVFGFHIRRYRRLGISHSRPERSSTSELLSLFGVWVSVAGGAERSSTSELASLFGVWVSVAGGAEPPGVNPCELLNSESSGRVGGTTPG
jgi:hypothetical protein